MRIVQLCNPASVGGLERVVQGLSSGLKKSGNSVAVIAAVEPGHDISMFVGPLHQSGVDVIRIDSAGRDYLGERKSISRALKEYAPDVVHIHGYRADLLHGSAVKKIGAARVSTLHGSSRMGGLSHLMEWLQLRSLRKFEGVVAVSSALREQLIEAGVSSHNVYTIPNAWNPSSTPLSRDDARRRLGIDVNVRVAGWTGRLIPIKGCDVLVRAVEKMKIKDVQFVVTGDGPERSALEQLSEEIGVKDRMIFVGARSDAAELMKAYDIFVMSSRSEGTPMVLLEAMGSGVPAVVTSVGGVPDVVKGVSDDWMVKPESPVELAAALDIAFSNMTSVVERGELAKKRISDEFGAVRWIERHEQLYRSAIDVAKLTNRKL